MIACERPDHCWHGDGYTLFCCLCPTVIDNDGRVPSIPSTLTDRSS